MVAIKKFNGDSSLSSVHSSKSITPQTLVQQVAYLLSNKVFSYSPESYDLDTAARHWSAQRELNSHGFSTQVYALQARTGAGTIPLGYNLSKDFDEQHRKIPQTIIGVSSTLTSLRPALEQLTKWYKSSSPLVAHISSLEYNGAAGGSLVADHVPALTIADELGLALVTSSSPHELQHMSLLATLLANVVPTIHIYDGLQTGRLDVHVNSVAGEALSEIYQDITTSLSSSALKRASPEAKVSRILKALNVRLQSSYQPFEYEGDEAPEAVIVVLGSAEAAVVSHAVRQLTDRGIRAGVITVRIYRPFFEDAFLNRIPRSARQVFVLGQVASSEAVDDNNVSSILYSDILATLSFSGTKIEVKDVKYAPGEIWNSQRVHELFREKVTDFEDSHFEIWDVDSSSLLDDLSNLATQIRPKSQPHGATSTTFNNTIIGGIVKADIYNSADPVDAIELTSSDAVFVGDEKILGQVNIVSNLNSKGTLIARLPDFKLENLEKRLGAAPLSEIYGRGIRVLVVDPSPVTAFEKPTADTILLELAFAAILPGFDFKTSLNKIARSKWLKLTDDSIAQFEAALHTISIPEAWKDDEKVSELTPPVLSNSFAPREEEVEAGFGSDTPVGAAKAFAFSEAYQQAAVLRPDLTVKTFTVHVKENRRLTPLTYDRNIFHIEFDLGDSGLKYNIGEALGIHGINYELDVEEFIRLYGLRADEVVEVPSRESPDIVEKRTVYQALVYNLDIFGKPPKRFYESLSEFATDEKEKKTLLTLSSGEGAVEFKRRSEVDTVTFADILLEFTSARLAFKDLIRLVSPLKRREYSIASSQTVTPKSVALLIVVVSWKDPRGRDRFGQCSRYLSHLKPGTPVTVSVKPSVMKLPTRAEQPLIMAGLGTGLAPFRAFVQHRAWQKAQGEKIGAVLLYMGSRHQREEYLYGEEWEAYQDAGVITLLGRAFSRDQPEKIYIQDRMRETLDDIIKAYMDEEGSFYLCGPTWPVPDVTAVLEDAIKRNAQVKGAKVDSRKEIEKLKEDLRYVLEVY